MTFRAFEEGGGLYSTWNARLADGFQAGAYLSQYEGIAVERDSAVSPGEMLVELRHQVGRAMDRLLPGGRLGFAGHGAGGQRRRFRGGHEPFPAAGESPIFWWSPGRT